MLNFSRKTEYALISLTYMSQAEQKDNATVNTREISDKFSIPYPLLAKILQKLANKGMIKSLQGSLGGYILAKKISDISVMDIAQIFEGSFAMVDCMKDEKITCPQWSGCAIKNPLYELNHKIFHLLKQTKLSDLVYQKSLLEKAS